MKKTKLINFKIDVKTESMLRTISKQKAQPMSVVIREAIRQYYLRELRVE